MKFFTFLFLLLVTTPCFAIDKLLLGAVRGDIELMKQDLEAGVDVNTKAQFNRTALMYSSWNGHLPAIEFLVSQGANIDSVDNQFGQSALFFAAENGQLDAVKLLIELGSNLQLINDKGQNLLMRACFSESLELVQYLIERDDVDINARLKKGRTAVMVASQLEKPETLKLLIDNGANVNFLIDNSGTALIIASFHGNAEIAKILVEAGADVDHKDKDGLRAIDYARKNGFLEFEQALSLQRKN